jgi:class 3 adenylate cyclase/TolB-like protein/Tfp pilus assembly protein PilF
MPEGGSRQLAAIMFADIVGYTALMQEDEDRARAHRDRQREVLSSLVPHHHGEILQYYGDGALCVFSSAVEAVECAVEIQLELRKAPEVPLRIGVHTGDIVHDGEGVYGDGVNVAARIEALAAPGGILISGKVFDEIKNHPALSSVPLGPVHLKNVGNLVRVYGISNHGLAVPTGSEIREKTAEAAADDSTSVDEAWDQPIGPGIDERGAGEAFLKKVRERAVIQWAMVYLAGAWAVLLTAGFVAEQLLWPPQIRKGLSILAFLGFFITMVVVWYHGEKGRQPVKAMEVAVISLLLVIGFGSIYLLRAEGGVQSGMPSLPSPRAEETRPSIAVLPFDNFSPDSNDAYFANGIQEDITTALSRIRALRVPARTSVARYRENRPGTREMATALGADFLLTGSTTVVGGMARITVALINGRTDEHVWAENYDHEFSVEQVIAVRSAVAQEVASRLRAIITPQEQARIATLPTEIPEAFELYQRARYRWNERTEPEVRKSLKLFQEAVDLDPAFAEAYAGLADAYLVLSNWGWMDHREGHRMGIAAAEQALILDSLNVNANASLGALHLWSTRDWARSEEYFLTAIRLDHDYAYTHYWYSALLSALERHDESIRQAEEAEELDPLSPQISLGLSRSLFLARQYRRAIEETSRAIEAHPEYGPLHAQLCRCYTVLGDFREAEAACRREQEVSSMARTLSMALVWAFQGDREAALGEVDGLGLWASEDGPQPIFLAMVYAGLGDTDAAFENLQFAFNEHYPYLEYLSSNPFFDPLRDDPRFEELLRGIGLEG